MAYSDRATLYPSFAACLSLASARDTPCSVMGHGVLRPRPSKRLQEQRR
jgi:hypothetical protein